MELAEYLSQIIYFIIPGVLFMRITNYILGKNSNDFTESFLNIFVASAISFLIGNGILVGSNKYFKSNFEITEITLILTDNKVSAEVFSAAILISIVLSFTYIGIINKNILFIIARFFDCTDRCDNNNVWDTLFQKGNQWITFRDYITNNTYYGRVEQLSDGSTEKELLLKNVRIYNSNSEEICSMDKVYLARKNSEFSIEIVEN